MFFLQKKLWIAWSKLRFLRLPPERRVRLEVTTDGRHITFILVSLYEAGYGVQVVGSPVVFRELICLRKSAPIPFVVGGEVMECGISISDRKEFTFQGSVFSQNSDRHSPLVTRNPSHILLDYDYFSGLNYAGVSHGGTANTEVGEDLGKNESRENSNYGLHEYTRIEAEQAGLRLAGQAGAGAHIAPGDRISQIGDRVTGSDGGNQSADSMEFLEGQSQAGLQMDKQKSSAFRNANDHTAPGEYSSSVLIRDIRGQKSGNIDFPPQALRAPYFMHPSVYHRGLHKRRSPSTALDSRLSTFDSAAKQRRRFRIGFFGTHDREFYTKHYHFPGMSRFEILEAFFEKFGDSFVNLEGPPEQWPDSKIVVSIDTRGGDRSAKAFLSQDHYFEALQECDFVLSPPGWCMPVSHNLIEAMFCGAMPITNCGAYMAEPLKNGETCLEFQDEEGLVALIKRALAMDAGEVQQTRQATRDYYERFLAPKAFLEAIIRSNAGRILANAEEKSVPLACSQFRWSSTIDPTSM